MPEVELQGSISDVEQPDTSALEPIDLPVTPVVDYTALDLPTDAAGPIITFGVDDAEPARALGDWVSRGEVDGPIIVFGINVDLVRTARDSYANQNETAGPIIVFGSDDTAPARDLGKWVSVGAVSGPTVVFSADTSAVQNALATYSGGGVIGTYYVDIVTRQSGPSPFRHGGVPGFAHGGIVARAAENNRPEVAHFANGGMARLENEGNYLFPPHTLISPSNTSRDSGGTPVVLTITGNNFYGGSRPDLDEWAAEVFVPAIAEEGFRQQKAAGR
jgi:hypothetical protein